MKILLLLIVTNYLLIPGVYCQNEKIDSLRKVLQTLKEDTNKVNTLNGISYEYKNMEPDAGLQYGQKALLLAENLKWKPGIAKAYKCIGNNYFSLGEFDTAMNFFQKGLKLNKETNNKNGEAENLMLIGTVYQVSSNYLTALEYFQKSLKLFQAMGDKSGIEKNLSNMAIAYEILGDYPKSLETFLKVVKLCEQSGDKEGLAIALNNIGIFYTDVHEYAKALEYCKKSMSIYTQLGNKNGVADCLGSIAIIYHSLSDLPGALKYHKQALVIYKGMDDKMGLAQTLGNIGSVYVDLLNYAEALKYNQESYNLNRQIGNKAGMSATLYYIGDIYFKADENSLKKMGISLNNNFTKAINSLKESLEIAEEIGDLDAQKYALEKLSAIYEKQGKINKAYAAYKNYIKVRDSLFDSDKKNEITQKQLQYDYDKKESLVKAEQDKKNALAVAEIKNQKNIRNFYITGATMLMASAGFGFFRYRRRKRWQSEQKLMNERLRISRELHDEVGATLSGISMYSHLTKQQIKNEQITEVEKSLNIMQQSAGEMVNKLNDIVWLINPDQDSLQKLIQRLEGYTRDMAAIKNMQIKINVPEPLQEYSLPMESRRNIYLFCKEAINNAVKYSNGTLLELNIKEVDNKLEFSVSDNGKGFDADKVKRGNGLENMQKRADEIGARLTVQSRTDEGSLVSMQIKIT